MFPLVLHAGLTVDPSVYQNTLEGKTLNSDAKLVCDTFANAWRGLFVLHLEGVRKFEARAFMIVFLAASGVRH